MAKRAILSVGQLHRDSALNGSIGAAKGVHILAQGMLAFRVVSFTLIAISARQRFAGIHRTKWTVSDPEYGDRGRYSHPLQMLLREVAPSRTRQQTRTSARYQGGRETSRTVHAVAPVQEVRSTIPSFLQVN